MRQSTKGYHTRSDIITSDVARMFREHKSVRDIANHYGCDPDTIVKRLDEAGISHEERHQAEVSRRPSKQPGHHKYTLRSDLPIKSPKDFTLDDVNKAVRLYRDDKLSLKKIGDIFNAWPTTISSVLAHAGIAQRRQNGDYPEPNAPCIHCPCCQRAINRNCCNRCKNTRRDHGFNSHIDYDEYLANGCWVCGDVAIGIDHDHNEGCPIANHSCEKCRRGPVCNRCNCIMKNGATAIALTLLADELDIKANKTRLCAKALERREQREVI